MFEAFAPTTITHLVMVLVEVNEMMRRKTIRRTAVSSLTIPGILPVIHVGVLECLLHLGCRATLSAVAEVLSLSFLTALIRFAISWLRAEFLASSGSRSLLELADKHQPGDHQICANQTWY